QHVAFKDKTPEEAIKMVVKAANLAWTKEDGVYYVAKDPATLPATDKPALPDAAKPEIPGLTTPATPSIELQLPQLIEQERDEEPREETRDSHYIRIRNISSRMIAWWIDPQNNPEPIEIAFARKSVDTLLNPWLAKPAMDPNQWSTMTGGGSVSSLPSRNVYNPYAPPGSINRGGSNTNSSAERFVTP
ncbi:MAG TPA: hypothetical protein VNA16_00025, partial [Abditibacteriaceae bacterium]|nr:hypothetical protein [Abditibacteriaceae bacterium]